MTITHPAVTHLRIIGLAGGMRTGKDEAAKYLAVRGYRRIALASPIKWAASADDGDLLKCGMPPRQIWQWLGTEGGRAIRKTIWTDLALVRMIAGNHFRGIERYVVSDVRFPDEAEAIKSWGGRIIELRRTAAPTGDTHVSETAVSEIKPDYVIHNEGTIHELCAQLLAALKEFGYAR